MNRIKFILNKRNIVFALILYFFYGYFFKNYLDDKDIYIYLEEYLGIYEYIFWISIITYLIAIFIKNRTKKIVLKTRLFFFILLMISLGYLCLLHSLKLVSENLNAEEIEKYVFNEGILNINLGYIEVYTFLKLYFLIDRNIFKSILVFIIFLSMIVIIGKLIKSIILYFINIFKIRNEIKQRNKRIEEERKRKEEKERLEKKISDEIYRMKELYKEKLIKQEKEKEELERKLKNMILASNSPRRREILENLGFNLEIKVKEVDEISLKLETSEKIKEISYKKAIEVAKENITSFVVGADTVVELDGVILGKPKYKEEAREMLNKLSGRVHNVITAYTLINIERDIHITKCVESKVFFKKISEEEIDWYIESEEPMDKAGAYGIQGLGSIFVEKIEGDFYAIMGFPVNSFIETLQELGVSIKKIKEI